MLIERQKSLPLVVVTVDHKCHVQEGMDHMVLGGNGVMGGHAAEHKVKAEFKLHGVRTAMTCSNQLTRDEEKII